MESLCVLRHCQRDSHGGGKPRVLLSMNLTIAVWLHSLEQCEAHCSSKNKPAHGANAVSASCSECRKSSRSRVVYVNRIRPNDHGEVD